LVRRAKGRPCDAGLTATANQAVPLATGVPLASAIDVVVYNTEGASIVDFTRLDVRLNKFSQVVGTDPIDSSDDS
jgi:hypothetical protein